MSQSHHFDAIVIGSGPGGEGAAMGLTKAGLNVAIVEKESSVGDVLIGNNSFQSPEACGQPYY